MKTKYSLVRVRASRRRFIPSILAAAVAMALAIKPSLAATAYWDSNGTTAGAGATPTGTWGTSAFWNTTAAGDTTTPGAWVSGDTAVFSAGADATTAYTVTLSGAQTIGGLTVEEGTPTISGAGTIVLGSAATPFVIDSGATIASAMTGAGVGLVKSGAATLTLSGVSTYSGGTTVNAGKLLLSGNTGGNTRIAGAVTVNASGILEETGDGTGFGYNSQITSLTINGGIVTSPNTSHIWNITGGITMTGGTLQSNGGVNSLTGGYLEWNRTNVTTLASASTATIAGRIRMRSDNGYSGVSFTVADGAAATDLLVGAALTQNSAGLGISKNGPGLMALTSANNYTGATLVNGGTLSLTGIDGGVNTSAPTISGGATLLLDNTGAVNNGNRLGDAVALTLNNGTLQFSHDGAAATNFSESVGTLNVASGANTINASQAASGQTSTLTFASVNYAGGSVNFTGTDLGVNSQNRIIFTSGLTNGAIIPWATINGAVAFYSTTDGVTTGSLTDVPFGGTIADGAASNIRLSGGTTGDVLLGSATTTVNSIVQNQTSATTIDSGAQILRLSAVGGIVLPSGMASLTINNGTLTAGATDNTTGILTLSNNDSTASLKVDSVIANNGTGVVGILTAGTGKVVLGAVNTYTGTTVLGAATTEVTGGTQTLAGVVSGTGALLKSTNTGTLTLSAANTYSGPTTVTAGTLKLGNAAGFGSSSVVTAASGATIDLAGFNTGRPVEISGTGVAGSALLNSSTTVGAAVGSLKLNADATISNAVPGADTSKMVNTATLNLNGNTVTIGSGTFRTGIRDITSGNIIINSGAALYSDNGGGQTAVTGTITINTGGVMDTRDTDNSAMTSLHTIALNGGSLGRGQITGNNGGGAGTTLKNNITVDATNGGSILNSSSGGFGINYRLSGAISGTGPLTLGGGVGVEFQGDASGYTGTATGTGGTITFSPIIATQTFGGNIAGTRPLAKNGANATLIAGNVTHTSSTSVNGGTLSLSGSNSSTGTTALSSGTSLKLDYSTNDNRKISSGILTLSGATVELIGGTFADSVASTTLTAATNNTVTRSSGSATLNLGAINFNTTGRLNLAQSGIARTTNANNALGILGSWATIGGSIPAKNDGTGLIVAATTMDLTRLSSGSKIIADGPTDHVRFIEGTGTAGSFTLGSPITSISTLTQSSDGGTSAATVELASQKLVLNTVTVGTGAGALTIASAPNLGFLKAAGTSLEFRDLAAAGITVNAIIEDGTGSTLVTKTDPGVLTLTGTNSYTGGTVVNAGTITSSLGTTAGVRYPLGTGAVTANSGTTLRFFAGGTANIMTFGNAFNLNGATLTSEDANQVYTGNIALTGANTVNVTYADKSATFSGIVSGGGSLTKALAGVLTLANANTYTGGTTITGGTIRTTNTAALGAAALVTLNGGTLQLATDTSLSSKNVSVTASSTIILDRATVGGGISTSLGNVSFGSNFTLTVNKGANVASGVSTLNFTGFPALGAAGTTTTFSVGQDVEVNLAGNLNGTQAFAKVTKTGAGTLILSGNNDWWDPATNSGLVTISGGTLDLRSQNAMGDGTTGANRIDLSMAAATTLRLGTNASLGNHANVTLTGSGATILSDRATTGAGITNQFNILSMGAHTLNVTGGSNVTSGTTQVNFNSATLTGNAVLNVVNPTAGGTNVLVSGVMGGAFSLTKSGSGTLTLQGANTISSTVAVTGGTLNLSGASGAIASSTGITLSNGGALTLANTSTANNGNRIAGTLAMNGGTLNFTNNQGAVNYSETTGALSVGGGINTIATGQAASGQTSILTFASLARTAGTLNFTGTGLGTTVDTKNEIRFTTAPTLTNGIIGTWATVNGTDFATTTGANNSIIAYTAYTDVTRLGVSAATIANASTSNVRIIEGTGSAFSILLGAPTTTINTLNQSTSGGTSAATIDPDAINNTLVTNSILVSAGAGGLTIGTAAADGTLKSAGTALQVIENSTGGSTINSLIADGTAASTFTKSGTGLLTLTASNTFTGATTIEGGTLAVSVLANGGVASGIGSAAVAQGNLVLSNGTLRYTGNTASSTRGFTIAAGNTGTVDVSTSAQTLTISGGIAATSGNLVKAGAGNLTLSAASGHSGTTVVTGGRLTVSSTMLNSSSYAVGTGAVLEFGATNIFVGGHGTALADNRTITADGGTLVFNPLADFRFGNVILSNGATWTSNRSLAAYDALLANTVSGPATVSVTGTSASTMNGTGGIHLQGIQNFNVADVTSSVATDLTVSMILGAQGTIGGTAGGINKIGAGTMSLQGVNAYTGATNVVAGVLAIGAGGSTQTSSTITVGSGATLRFDRSDIWGNHTATTSSPIVVNQGTLATNGNFNTIINPVLNGGTVTLNGGASASYPALAIKGTLTAGGTAASTINVGTGSFNFINIGPSGTAGTLIVDVADATASTATDLTINSVLQNNWNAAGAVQVASVLQKTGAGTLNLAPAGGGNTFTGGLTVSNGLLLLTGSNLGNSVAGAGTLTIDSGATARAMSHNSLGQGTGTLSPLFVNGGTFEGAEYNHISQISMTGGSIVQRSGITVVDGLDMKVFNTLNPSITTNASATQANISLKISNSSAGSLTATVADGAAATDLSISAAIVGPRGLIKAGAGTLNLSGANTYAGGTTLNQGTLTVGSGGTLGATTGALSVNNTNTGAGTDTILNLATGVNTTTGSLSGTIATPSGGVNTATINTQAGRTLTVNQIADGTFAGVIAGTGDFILGSSSTNTLTLTGANTYTGTTTVSAGTLALVGGSQASPITVSTGASLSFTLGSPTTSTSSFDVTAGTIKISGTPTLPRYTLISSSTGITGTPTLNAAIPGYMLQKYGNSLVLETIAQNLYQAWADTTYAPPLTAKLLTDDQDTDGLNNLREYAFGTHPTVNSVGPITYASGVVTSTGQPVIVQDGGVWYAVFGRRVNYVDAGLTYTVEFSNNLTPWAADATTPTVIATDGVIEAVRVPFPNFVDGPSGPQKPQFFRVVITSSF